ncbi:MAG: GNAT family N-acetyltransferase [Saccharofermentanales bacterium]
MNLTIKPLTPDLTTAYLDFFDNRAFSKTDTNGPCYCTSPMQTSEEIDQMVSEFEGDVKGTIRRHAVKMLVEGRIHGYLAFYGDTVIGWCNARDMSEYIKNRYQFIPDFAWEKAIGKTMSVVCFSIAPEYRGKGVSTALLERVITDAETEGFEAVEGYAHIRKEQYDMDFKGPTMLYAKLGFIPVAEQDGVVVMRKTL